MDTSTEPTASAAALTAEATGQREAAVLETAGLREASALHVGGVREAEVLAAQRASEASVLRVEGQRTINLIWETTQMKVALSVIWGSLTVASALAVFGRWLGSPDLQLAAIVFLFGVANLVTGFYFGRTNHTKVGGITGDEGER